MTERVKARNTTLAQQLSAIESELRRLGLWRENAPSDAALSSTVPFCIDTLSLAQWLQWILIPRIREVLRRGQPLPGNSNIHAIAEESFKEFGQESARLLMLIATLDQTLSEARPRGQDEPGS